MENEKLTATLRTVLRETPNGPIEIVMLNHEVLSLQFNTTCTDALPICKAICCRMRSSFAVQLEPDELAKFKHIQNPTTPGRPELRILQSAPDGHTCTYLTPESRCEVHADKPRHCSVWHCSPGGKGDGVKYRALGWALLPFTGEVPAEMVVESMLGLGKERDDAPNPNQVIVSRG